MFLTKLACVMPHLQRLGAQMMNVSEVAREAGVTAHTVRYYTRLGLLKPQRDPRSQYKKFEGTDIARLKFIFKARRLGFKLSEIAEIFRRSARRQTPCPIVREIVERRISEFSAHLDAVIALRERMKRALVKWEKMPDGVPNGHAVCVLIEATD